MEIIKYIAVIVVYNKECSESMICRRLLDIQKDFPMRVIIADNSTIKTKNEEYIKSNKWEYISMRGNVGLSIAYNRAIEYINTFADDTVVIWFDDDTEITKEYFLVLDENIRINKEANIFVPVVYDINQKIYSPNERRFFKNKLIKTESEIPRKEKFNAINSCMAIRTSVFDKYRYDETLFMDSVDQKFCEDMCERGYYFYKIPVKIMQNFFQRSQGLTAQKAWTRYSIRIRDFMNYSNKDWIHRWLAVIKVAAWGVQIGLKCKSVVFAIRCIGLALKYAVLLSLKKRV